VSSECEWEVVVRLFGYPRVENRKGNSVDFRKRKALELLTWLSINRDRPLRSAARTAMWESNISDSSFATVVSDMRRCLSELCPHVSPRDWAPPTFTDDIVLSKKIVTDVELLRNAWQRFETDRSTFTEVVAELSRVRDLPFAGANYCWPDIDGSTTRFVMMGANIAREVAYWAYDNKKWDEVTIAATAGLRLLPGDEELLDLQRLVLQTSRSGLD
jgi:two-component SAPR family response regulator